MAEFNGLNNFISWANNIPNQLADEVKDIVKHHSYQIVATAKNLCPVDTGHLRRSIDADIQDSETSIKATIGTNVHYAEAVEFGTSRMPSRPYLTPAYLRQKAKFESDMRDALNGVGG